MHAQITHSCPLLKALKDEKNAALNFSTNISTPRIGRTMLFSAKFLRGKQHFLHQNCAYFTCAQTKNHPNLRSLALEVASHTLVETFGAVPFLSFTAIEKATGQSPKDNYVVFVRLFSDRSANAVLLSWTCFLIKNSAQSTGCPVRFCLRRQKNHLIVTSYFFRHNHKLSKVLYNRLPANQGLTEDELGACRCLLNYGTPSCKVRQFAADEFSKILATQDIHNYRRKCRPALLSRCRIVGFYCGR
ncbi:hypothetical protein CSKR_103742 [Clonorchis sinensis]|uniref:Uncharacterized protein n=1 Tax=Clonorchis sinensis TaxID=79923 RepID=A0A419QEE9_CLOSI|nr:hypothetical protein CSKR_103742 [Clonorchis sinensis]